MPDNQHPGGVAGRVIRECEQQRYGGFIANGAYRMREAMSREARGILGEWLEKRKKGNNLVDAAASDAIEYLTDAFQRLGLDLEGESDDR